MSQTLTPSEVRQVQEKLGIAVDGDFGPATKRAVEREVAEGGRAFVADGDFGPATLRALGVK
jgi:peptidoglycan hydrolase-like protein with peptidoglycan-binding domain